MNLTNENQTVIIDALAVAYFPFEWETLGAGGMFDPSYFDNS